MSWAVLVARLLVGLPFFVFGLEFFLKFMPPMDKSMPDAAKKFLEAIGPTGYLAAVKVLEVTGGALLLSGRLVPFGLVLLTPVAVNIALFDLFLMGQPGLGIVLVALCGFLVWAYRSHFATVFAIKAKIG